MAAIELPKPPVNGSGNLKQWIIFITAVSAIVVASSTGGVWIATRAPESSVKALADSLGAFRAEVKAIRYAVESDRGYKIQVGMQLDDLSGKLDHNAREVARIRITLANLATRAWVMSLKDGADADHKRISDDVEDTRKRLNDLRKDLEELKKRKGGK